MNRWFIMGAVAVCACCFASFAQTAGTPPGAAAPRVIDLATVLELAGANNLDVQLAREKVVQAEAAEAAARLAFFPWLEPGLSYRRHDHLTQNTDGNLVDVHKQVYTIGASVAAQTKLGDAFFQEKAAKHVVIAAGRASDARRAEIISAAAQAYFDLARAQGERDVAAEALRISRDYQNEVQHAVAAGLAFQGDFLRVKVQTANAQKAQRQAEADERVASARLAQILNLDPATELTPRETMLAPLTLASASTDAGTLVQQAWDARPEIRESRALREAAQEARRGAVFGPLIPTLRGEGFFGGLNGGRGSTTNGFGRSEDYLIGFGWRIGPGGMFDSSRLRASRSRLRTTEIDLEKIHRQIAREVVAANTRVASFGDQLSSAREALDSAQAAWRLIEQRRTFGVGLVLEALLAQQDLTKARRDYLAAVADYDKAQYELLRALGTVK